MSTRAQIEFQGTWIDKNGKEHLDRRTVYRHSDGYPEGECGVISELKEFVRWNLGRNNDVEYAAANFIYWSKRRMEENYFKPDEERKKWSDFGSTNYGVLHTGFGVCQNDELHGDVEYFYVVRNEGNKIKADVYDMHPKTNFEVKEWIKKVNEYRKRKDNLLRQLRIKTRSTVKPMRTYVLFTDKVTK